MSTGHPSILLLTTRFQIKKMSKLCFLLIWCNYSTFDHNQCNLCLKRVYQVCACVLSCFSHIRLFMTLCTVAHQAPLSMGFSRQECWSGLPSPSLGDLPSPGIEPVFPELAGGFLTTSTTCLYIFGMNDWADSLQRGHPGLPALGRGLGSLK